MLKDKLKDAVKEYLADAAKNTELACNSYDTFTESSDLDKSISSIQEMINETSTDSAKKILENSLKNLKKEQQKEKYAKVKAQPTVKLVMDYTGTAVFGVLPLAKTQSNAAKCLENHVEETIRTLKLHKKVRRTTYEDNNYLTFQAIIHPANVEVLASELAKEYDGPKINCEIIQVGLLESSLEEPRTKSLKPILVTPEPEKPKPAKTTKKAKLAPSESGYLTVEEAAELLGKSKMTIRGYVHKGMLKYASAKRKIDGRHRTVFSYKNFAKFRLDNFEPDYDKAKILIDIAEGHSDINIIAIHGIPANDLAELKQDTKADEYLLDKSKKFIVSESDKQKIMSFYQKHGTDQDALEKAKKKFPEVPVNTLQGYKTSFIRWHGKKTKHKSTKKKPYS